MKTVIVILAILSICASFALAGVLQSTPRDQCFVHGQCVKSTSFEIVTTSEEFECLDACKREPLCEWFTYYSNSGICELFKDCVELNTAVCDDCVSGENTCEQPAPLCFITGQCEGKKIVTVQAESKNECLNSCKSESTCRWFTFSVERNLCFLFSECELIDESTEGFLSGERRCNEDSPPRVFTKVLVAGGSNSSYYLSDMEIIDLLSNDTTCQKLPNFPEVVSEAIGGLDFRDRPFVCGGFIENSSSCYFLDDGTWNNGPPLNEGRFYSAITQSPFAGSKYFVTGGYGKNTSEVYTENGWEMSVPFPTEVHFHCMTYINSTMVILMSGLMDYSTTKKTFFFNSQTNIWTEGPTLPEYMTQSSCGLIRKDDQTQEKTVIIAGGAGSGITSSTFALDLDSVVWRRTSRLPDLLYKAALVQDPYGGVIVIGGLNFRGDISNKLYRLPHAKGSWETMPQQLSIPRHAHTAILIPDELALCN